MLLEAVEFYATFWWWDYRPSDERKYWSDDRYCVILSGPRYWMEMSDLRDALARFISKQEPRYTEWVGGPQSRSGRFITQMGCGGVRVRGGVPGQVHTPVALSPPHKISIWQEAEQVSNGLNTVVSREVLYPIRNVTVEVQPLQQLRWPESEIRQEPARYVTSTACLGRPLCNQTKQWTLVRNLCYVTLIYDFSVTAPCSCRKYSLTRKYIYRPNTVVCERTISLLISCLGFVPNK